MKKHTRLTAVILTVVMLMSVCSAAFCSGAQTADVGAQVLTGTVDTAYPLIILPGINHSTSYIANDDGTVKLNDDGQALSGGLLIIDTSGLVQKLVKKLLIPLLTSLFMQFDNGLSEAAYEVVTDLFSLQSSDNNGVQVNNIQTYSYDYPVSEMDEDTRSWFYRMLPMQKVSQKIGEDNVYLFTFPLIGDPMESGRQLVDYIEMVKRQKGVDKVNIATVSLGGTILTAYADIINGDWSNVNQIINVVSLLNGTDIIADFYAREWNLSDEYLYNQFIVNVMTETNGSPALGYLINATLRLFSRSTVEGLLTGAYTGILDTLLLNCPQFWAMIPAERYEALAQRYLSDADHTVLKAKTDAFQQARVNLNDNLLTAKAAGVSVNNICGTDLKYDQGEYCFLGIVASTASCNSDGIIPVYSTSLGATSVPAGTTFSDDYLASAQSKYISPKKSVDASTCLFPDNVWFFVGQHHEIGNNDVAIELLSRIITGEITDVNSSPEFPQYNGFRNTKALNRWYLDEARTVMANSEGKYTDEQIAEVSTAYDEALALLEVYNLSETAQADADAVTAKLKAALVNVGVETADEEEKVYMKILEFIAKVINYIIFMVFGGKGYLDATPIGGFFSKLFS